MTRKRVDEENEFPFLNYAKYIFIFIFFLFITYNLAKIIFKPNLDQYPALNTCFVTTVHKIKLCNASPNYSNLGSISNYFIHSVLISEDDSFYLHKGIDWTEFKRSFVQNLKLKRFARGGSTITQQLVKNSYLTQNKSILRKFKEILLAQQIEEKYSKAVILEKYLNVIELGNDIYGVKQASRAFFGKSPSQLNILEAVYLTTLLPNPKVYSSSLYKGQLPGWQRSRIETLLHRLLRRKRISEDLYNVAKSKIDLFPWKGIELYETQETEKDNLDFLDNSDELEPIRNQNLNTLDTQIHNSNPYEKQHSDEPSDESSEEDSSESAEINSEEPTEEDSHDEPMDDPNDSAEVAPIE